MQKSSLATWGDEKGGVRRQRKQRSEQENGFTEARDPLRRIRGHLQNMTPQLNLTLGSLPHSENDSKDPRPPHFPSFKLKGCNCSQELW